MLLHIPMSDGGFQKMHLTDNHVINFKCDMGQCHMAHMSHESCIELNSELEFHFSKVILK